MEDSSDEGDDGRNMGIVGADENGELEPIALIYRLMRSGDVSCPAEKTLWVIHQRDIGIPLLVQSLKLFAKPLVA